jgi:hypothetical protein
MMEISNEQYAPEVISGIIIPLVQEGLGEEWMVHSDTALGHAGPHLLKCKLVVNHEDAPEQTYQAISVIDTDLHVRSQVKILVDNLKDMIAKKEAALLRTKV